MIEAFTLAVLKGKVELAARNGKYLMYDAKSENTFLTPRLIHLMKTSCKQREKIDLQEIFIPKFALTAFNYQFDINGTDQTYFGVQLKPCDIKLNEYYLNAGGVFPDYNNCTDLNQSTTKSFLVVGNGENDENPYHCILGAI